MTYTKNSRGIMRVLLIVAIVNNWPLFTAIQGEGNVRPPHTGKTIMNVNFGAFLTPQGDIVNSGSTWTHTFQIENVIFDPIPPTLRSNSSLTYKGCSELVRALFREEYDYDVKTATAEQLQRRQHQIMVETELCQSILTVADTFNQQKNILINKIDNILDTIKEIVLARDPAIIRRPDEQPFQHEKRKKRAPLNLVGTIGEKLFGLGRKESIDMAHRNHYELVKQVNDSFGKIAGNMHQQWSVTKMHNKAIKQALRQLKKQEKEYVQLARAMVETQDAVTLLREYDSTQLTLVYGLVTHQAKMFSQTIKTTTAILNTLQLTHVQMNKVLMGLQQLMKGELPIQFVTPAEIRDVLSELNFLIRHGGVQFRIPIPHPRYYYSIPSAGFG